MNSFFPLVYLTLIIIFLFIILIFVLAEIFSIQILQKQIKALKIKIDLRQASLDTYTSLGQIFLQKQRYSDAIEIYRKCLLKWNKNDKVGLVHIYMAISLAYSKLTIFDFAQIYLEQSIFNVPTCILALNNIVYIYKQRSFYKKYIETLIYIDKLTLKNNK